MKRIGAALIGALVGVALLAYLPGSSALATSHSGSTTLTLTAGTDTSSARPFTFQPGVAYDITVAGTIAYSFTNSSPPTTCVHDTFYEECHQTGAGPGSWQRQDELQVFDDPHNYSTNSALPASNTMTVQFNTNNTYSWVVPANYYGSNAVTKYFWANPWGQPETYTTTYSGQITVTITPHVQQNRFGVRFSAVGLPRNPPGGLKDVTLAGSGRVQLEEYTATSGTSFQGPATAHVTDVEYIKVGSSEAKRTIKLAQTSGPATLQNLKDGGQLVFFQELKVTDSNDPQCEKGLSTAWLHVWDSPSKPDRVSLHLHCESAHGQHIFSFDFTNSPNTHVTTAIVGPQ